MRLRFILFLFVSAICGCATAGDAAFYKDLEAQVEKATLYPNEQTLLTHRIYARVDLRYEGFQKEPVLPFMWFEIYPFELKDVNSKVVKRNGLKWVSATIKKTAIFPMKPGNFTLYPGQIKATFMTSKNQKEQMQESLLYDPITINVIDFPKEGMPDDFNGFSGMFSLTTEGTVAKEKQGEYILIILKVSGEGNIRQVPMPKLNIPNGLSIKNVIEKVEIKYANSKVEGNKTFEVEIRPEKPGSFKIPAPHFSFFDVATKTYVQVKGQDHEFVIASLSQFDDASDFKNLKGNKIAMLLDISGSMMAKDFAPEDRLTFAKKSIIQLLSDPRMQKNSTGLTAFAKQTKEVWPFGSYKKEYIDSIHSIESTEPQADGTAIGSALYEAVKEFDKISVHTGKKFILLITDGTLNAGYIDGATAAHFAAEKLIPVYSIGIGKGGKVPFTIKDKDFGNREIETDVEIDEKALEEIARVTNGKSFIVKSETDFKTAVQELAEIFSS